MTRKALNIAAVSIIINFMCVSVLCSQPHQGAKANNQDWAFHKGKATSVLNVPSYTYIELEGESGRTWIAVSSMEAKVGDKVWASEGIEMRDHNSKALDRIFSVIHFVSRAETERGRSEKTTKKKGKKKKIAASPLKGRIAKAKGGYTIKELYDKKKKLEGKELSVKGMVVKAAAKIMGKRWFHLQDGTGDKEVLDLVITSDNDAERGDIILVTGTLGVDVSFGHGYNYDIIIQNAKIKVEQGAKP